MRHSQPLTPDKPCLRTIYIKGRKLTDKRLLITNLILNNNKNTCIKLLRIKKYIARAQVQG